MANYYSCAAFILFCGFHTITYSDGNLADAIVEPIGSETISIRGIITPATAEKFKSLLQPGIKTVLISSEGGVTESALDIAEKIQKRHLDIEIIDFCASSCANYLFVAGENKHIREGAIVGWHGGHSFKPFRPAVDSKERLKEKERLLLREQLLYARAGTSIDLIVYSGLLTLGESLYGTITREYTLWVPDINELRRLGVKNISGHTSMSNASDIDSRLAKMGFSGQHSYVGPAYSYLPAFTSNY
ncbi:MAG: hypothetical protein QM788_01845 [Roseateles sp.]|uniref:hypothetical protein n=1 Tax=Roseateles sp. TaxID=1971397 RepID=UPI0039EAC19D